MNDLQAQFNNWLDSELKVAGAIAKAFCINIYQEDVEDVYILYYDNKKFSSFCHNFF